MVPEGWKAATYGDVMAETGERGGSDASLPVLSVTKSRGPMLASERFDKVMHGRDLSKYRVARRDDVVADPMLLWDGSIGRQIVVDAGLVSPDYRVYKPSEHAHPAFLGFVVRSAHMLPHYQGGARGTNVRRNRIARSDFLAIPLPLPPLPEQRKIAAILSSVDEAIEATQAVIEQLQVVKKAMMAELLTRGLPGRHTRFKQTEIGEIPEEWEVASLGDVVQSIDSGWSPQCEARPAGPDEWGVLKVSSVTSGAYLQTEHKALPPTLKPRPEAEVRSGDVLLARANGVLELVGKTVIVRATRPRLMLSDKLLRLRPDTSLLSAPFLALVMATDAVRTRLMSTTGGSHMRNVSQASLRALRLPLPKLDEQRSVADAVAALEDRLAAENLHLIAMSNVKSALSSALLSGELRVTPDEPSP